MSNTRRKRIQNQAKNSIHEDSKSESQTRSNPIEEIPNLIGNQAFGHYITSHETSPQSITQSYSLPSPPTHHSTQSQTSFRGLSQDLTGESQALVQAKLTVNNPGDSYEQEADRVADRILAQMQVAESVEPQPIDELPASELLMREVTSEATSIALTEDFEHNLQQEQSRGQPLDSDVQVTMENAFGADFNGVKIHTSNSSDSLNQTIQAKAFTTGQDIFFKRGAYQPKTQEGQRLIAHELTHVIQQNGSDLYNDHSMVQRKEEKLLSKEKGTKTKSENKEMEQAGTGFQNITDKKTSLAGAEIAAKKVINSSDQDFQVACDLLMKAGFFGSYKTTVETRRTTVELSDDLFVGSEFKGKVSAEIKDVIEGIKLLAEASAQVGVGNTLSERLAINSGKNNFELKAKLDKFVGFKASAKGELKLNVLDGLVVSGSAEAQAGAMGSLSGSAQLSRGDLGVQVASEVKGFAGASAKAKGNVQLGPAGIAGSASAESFAGATVSGKISGSITTRKGTKLINISTGGDLSAGIGAKVKGEFTARQGQFKLGTAVGGALGVGGGAEISIEIDISAIKGAIKDACSSSSPSSLASKVAPQRPYMPEADAQSMKSELYSALFPKVYDYALKKAGKSRSEHYVKRQMVQEIINAEVQKSDRLAELIWYKEADEVLAEVAYDATTKAANEFDRSGLISSQSSFVFRRGIIILWPYKDK